METGPQNEEARIEAELAAMELQDAQARADLESATKAPAAAGGTPDTGTPAPAEETATPTDLAAKEKSFLRKHFGKMIAGAVVGGILTGALVKKGEKEEDSKGNKQPPGKNTRVEPKDSDAGKAGIVTNLSWHTNTPPVAPPSIPITQPAPKPPESIPEDIARQELVTVAIQAERSRLEVARLKAEMERKDTEARAQIEQREKEERARIDELKKELERKLSAPEKKTADSSGLFPVFNGQDPNGAMAGSTPSKGYYGGTPSGVYGGGTPAAYPGFSSGVRPVPKPPEAAKDSKLGQKMSERVELVYDYNLDKVLSGDPNALKTWTKAQNLNAYNLINQPENKVPKEQKSLWDYGRFLRETTGLSPKLGTETFNEFVKRALIQAEQNRNLDNVKLK